MNNFIFFSNSTLTVVSVPSHAAGLYSLDSAARLVGVHPNLLRYYCRRGLLGAERAETKVEPSFDEAALEEVRQIEHYRRNLGVTRRGLPLLCELRREGDRQQIELRFLRHP